MSEDNSWVFDSLVCFLHGPVWNAPLQTFIEEKSLIFDPNGNTNDQNPEYRIIHEEYKHLVDYMLGSFMEEMQITPEQFEIACLEGRHGVITDGGAASNGPIPFSFHKGLFQQIWAANDIRIFIRMMTQRNVEIQLQALDLIERRQNSMQRDDSQRSITNETEPSEDQVTQSEIDQIVEEENLQRKSVDSQELNEETNPIEIDDPTEKFERLNLFFKQESIDSANVKSRQEYLRSQRDKIIELKKKARANQLNETVKKNIGRPTSAHAAQKVLENDGKSAIDLDGRSNEASLQLRKTLAKRLRDEVVEQE